MSGTKVLPRTVQDCAGLAAVTIRMRTFVLWVWILVSISSAQVNILTSDVNHWGAVKYDSEQCTAVVE